MDSSADTALRDRALRSLSRRGEFRRHFRIGSEQAAYLRDWYVLAVHALSGTRDFRADPKWIARRLAPPVTAGQAGAALRLLRRLGLIGEGTKIEPVDLSVDSVTTDPPAVTLDDGGVETGPAPRLDAEVFQSYHIKGAQLGLWAIQSLKERERCFGSVTAALNEEGVERLFDAVTQKRRELSALLQELQTDDADTVVHVNLQAFPLTKSPRNEDNKEGAME